VNEKLIVESSGGQIPLRIPIYAAHCSVDFDLQVSTTAYDCARNSPNSYSEPQMDPSMEITFEIRAKVERDLSAAVAASRANLLKASKVRWPHRKRLT
jgi:hypothetical protein